MAGSGRTRGANKASNTRYTHNKPTYANSAVNVANTAFKQDLSNGVIQDRLNSQATNLLPPQVNISF
jgi:hypothetical protein